MENIQIPIYRAKRINSDELESGDLIKKDGKYYISQNGWEEEVDPSTLSISFPDMFDSQGTRIFASLSDDGKGGDICIGSDIKYFTNKSESVVYYGGCITIGEYDWCTVSSAVTVIGIQE